MNYNNLSYRSDNMLSPPITPKDIPKPQFFYSADIMNDLPLSPPIYDYIIPNKRKQKKPIKSFPIHTQGSFSMPIKYNSQYKIQKKTKSCDTEPLPKQSSSSLLKIQSLPESDPIKKIHTTAGVIYDHLGPETDPHELFKDAPQWIPKNDIFDRRRTVRIAWKGPPLKLKHMPYIEKLHPLEVGIASTLRLTPEQYLKCKWAIVLGAKEAYETDQLFRKSEAQKVCCIDVNKTSLLWQAFGKLGWLGPKWPQ